MPPIQRTGSGKSHKSALLLQVQLPFQGGGRSFSIARAGMRPPVLPSPQGPKAPGESVLTTDALVRAVLARQQSFAENRDRFRGPLLPASLAIPPPAPQPQ